MRRTVLIVLSALAVLGTVAMLLTWRLTSPEAGPDAPISSGRGLVVRFFDAPQPVPRVAVTDLAGRPLSSDDWRGKVVLVNFWATWCGPCRAEIPILAALQERYRDRLLVVGLSIDTEPADTVQAFARELGVNYPVAMASPELERAFGGIMAVPMTFVVNPAGDVVQRHLGVPDPRIVEHEIRALSGLPTEARVETIADPGHGPLADAAYATEIPGVDLSGLTPAQKQEALQRLNTEHCECGCDLTLAQCRINDPACEVSPGLANAVVAAVAGRTP